ncbi:MAG: hypothetical protein JEY91_19270 [Spirochaetaceae bacterium]|nr:hypothetical protein [Spirochaetaceae bacterium]
MNTIVRFFSKSYIFLCTTIVFIIFLIVVLPGQSEKAALYTPEAGSFDTSFFYAPQVVYDTIAAYGETGRAAYIYDRWTFDLIFPFVYGLFILSAIAFSVFRIGWVFFRSSRWIIVPIAAMVLDLLENTFLSLAMGLYPSEYSILAVCASAATVLKWLFVTTAMGLAFLFPLLLVVNKLTDRRKRNTGAVE